MLSRLAHAHCSVARGLNTSAHLSPHSPRVFILDSGTTDLAPSTCTLSALRLNSTAAHFFPHTRPTNMQAGLECLGSLVNSYLPGLRSIQRARQSLLDSHVRHTLAITLHTPGVLLIFQHRPVSLAAQFFAMKMSRDTSTDSSRLLVSSTVGF
jgi:hypothetical protein